MEKAVEEAKEGALVSMQKFFVATMDLEKPLVLMISGGIFGVACTHSAFADFIYCTPEAIFKTPFMTSFQSPEGGSTVTFPAMLGRRLASEMLLVDKTLTAKEAL